MTTNNKNTTQNVSETHDLNNTIQENRRFSQCGDMCNTLKISVSERRDLYSQNLKI